MYTFICDKFFFFFFFCYNIGQETERVYSYNPGASMGLKHEKYQISVL